jgi:hypothetical protein
LNNSSQTTTHKVTKATFLNGNNTYNGNQVVTGSFNVSGSNTIVGNTTISGSLDVSGSSNFHNSIFIVTGSQYLTGSQFITGSINMLGSLNVNGSIYKNGNKQFNYGQWYSLQNQTGSANTVYPMRFEVPTPDLSGMYVGNNGSGFPTRIYVENNGLYNIQFSAQLHTTSNESVDFSVWFAMTGSNIANSNTDFSIEKVSGGGFQVAALNFLTPISSGSYVELYWSKTTVRFWWDSSMVRFFKPTLKPSRPSTRSACTC